MKAIQANLLKFLKKSTQFVIPIYQRNYAWTPAQCLQMWNDLLRAGRNGALEAHFIGSIVYVENGAHQVMGSEALLVIDGQQRLTTCPPSARDWPSWSLSMCRWTARRTTRS